MGNTSGVRFVLLTLQPPDKSGVMHRKSLQDFTSSSTRPAFGKGEAMAPMPNAPISSVCCVSLWLSLIQAAPICTITLKPSGTDETHFSASFYTFLPSSDY